MDLFLKEGEYWDNPKAIINIPWDDAKLTAIFFDQIKKGFLKVIKDAKPSRILEIGCGEGWLGEEIQPFVDEYVGVDLSKSRIQRARKRLIKADLIQGNILDISFKRASFDMVIAWDSLHHFPDIDALYKKIFFWLKKRQYRNTSTFL